MKIHVLLLSCISFCISLPLASAQSNAIGLSLNPGISYLSSSDAHFKKENENQFAFSGNAGLFFEEQLNRRFTFGAELLLVQIEGRDVNIRKEFELSLDANGEQDYFAGSFTAESRRYNFYHSTYIGLPFYLISRFEKFSCRLGAQVMLQLASFQNDRFELHSLYYPTIVGNNERIPGNFDRFDYGPKLGFDYQLNQRWRLRSDFYQGLPNIANDETTKRNRQFSLGLGYVFYKE